MGKKFIKKGLLPILIFLTINFSLYKLGHIDSKTLLLSLYGTGFFSQFIDFDYKKLGNWIFIIILSGLYIFQAIR